MVQPGDYESLMRSALHGEMYGEAFFVAFAEASTSDEERTASALLAQLERHVADKLRESLGADAAEVEWTEEEERATTALAQDMAIGGFDALLPALGGEIGPALERFGHLRSVAPQADDPAVVLLIEHEEALAQFVELWQSGHSERACDQIATLLERSSR